MEWRLQSIIGHKIFGTDLYWGALHGRAVEVTRTNSTTIHADLVGTAAADSFEASLQNLTFTNGWGIPFCPTITVQADGSVSFSLS
jgi:hypothetical protein